MKLYEWFGSKDSFIMEKDFKKIILVSEEQERDRASLLCALDSLEKYEVIQSSVLNPGAAEEQKVWTLSRPLESMSQNLELTYDLAGMVATVINDFGTAIGRKDGVCDPSQINADNIRDLVFITNFYLNEPPNDKKD